MKSDLGKDCSALKLIIACKVKAGKVLTMLKVGTTYAIDNANHTERAITKKRNVQNKSKGKPSRVQVRSEDRKKVHAIRVTF